MRWPAPDGQSQHLDLSSNNPGRPGALPSQQPPPRKSGIIPLPSPLDLTSLGFPTHDLSPNANCEVSDRNRVPLKFVGQTPSQKPQQTTTQLHSPYLQSNSIEAADPSTETFTPYHMAVTSSTSTSIDITDASQCIFICTQIISQLESQTNDRNLGLDRVLNVSKSCISGLLQITTREACKTNLNCLLLLCVAANQATTLFEKKIPEMNTLLKPVPIPTLPSILFGSFQVDQEDQLAFCNRLICRETQRCRQLLDRMRGIYYHHLQQQQSHPSEYSPHSAASLLQQQWFLALAGRLDCLVAALST